MLRQGTSYFHFEGLTWDGAGKAATGVDHNSQTHYGTWMRHRNCAYQNFSQAGVRVGGNQNQPPGLASEFDMLVFIRPVKVILGSLSRCTG
jgi:hypothetical protein